MARVTKEDITQAQLAGERAAQETDSKIGLEAADPCFKNDMCSYWMDQDVQHPIDLFLLRDAFAAGWKRYCETGRKLKL